MSHVTAIRILLPTSAMNSSLAPDRFRPYPEWLLRFYDAQSCIVPPISVACCVLLIIVVLRCSPPAMGAFKWLVNSPKVGQCAISGTSLPVLWEVYSSSFSWDLGILYRSFRIHWWSAEACCRYSTYQRRATVCTLQRFGFRCS